MFEGQKRRVLQSQRDRQYIKGYMTVEATLIMSIVFMVYLFLIQSFLWIYDRCALELDMASLVLKCVNAKEDTLERVWQQETEKLDLERYLWLELEAPLLQKKGWKLTVTGSGVNDELGDCKILYEVWQFTPKNWLRLKHKIEQEEKER